MVQEKFTRASPDLGLAVPATAAQAPNTTPYPPMVRGDTAATSQGWEALSRITVSESGGGYTPIGIIDVTDSGPGVDAPAPDAACAALGQEAKPQLAPADIELLSGRLRGIS